MALPQNTNWTIQQYFDYEHEQEDRHEFLDGQVYLMAGATENHNELAMAVGYLLYGAFMARPCRVFQSDMKVQINQIASFYPNVVVACEPLQYATDTHDRLLNPSVIFEILSPSTEDYDRGRKFKQYQKIASLQDYVLISQEYVQVDHYHRQDDITWWVKSYSKRSDILQLSVINVTLALDALYRNVNVTSAPDS